MKILIFLFNLIFFINCDSRDYTPSSSTIEAALKKIEIVPDIIDKAPNNFLTVIYPNGRHVNLGNTFSPVELIFKPKIYYEYNASDYYTLLFVEPDRPAPECSPGTQMLHWQVINIPGNDLSSGFERAFYFQPVALPVGIFRYTFLLARQKYKLDTSLIDVILSLPGRLCFKTMDYINKNNMELVAANFFVPNKSLNPINVLGLQSSSDKKHAKGLFA